MEIIYIEPELIIEINRKIIEEWNARHPEQPEFIDVSKTRLYEVLEIVRQAGKGSDLNDKIIIKAAHLLGGMAWTQAFSGANKRTAILSTTVFLRRNGLRFTIPKEQQRELRKMLFDVQEQRDTSPLAIINKIILYIKGNVIQL
ncbi:MAG: type II toxin-antitoxin system death-on-curing family toxin [Nitrosopumilaceae archaeon]